MSIQVGPRGCLVGRRRTGLNLMLDGWRRCAMSDNSLFPGLGQFLGVEGGLVPASQVTFNGQL